jgi:AraC-like DNA-binding protein
MNMIITIYWTDVKSLFNDRFMAALHGNSPASLLCLRPDVTLSSASREHPAVRTARQYMEVHFGENISIAKLAALVSLSPYHFVRVFGRQTSFPPHAYLEGIRIRKAREFLDRGHTLASAALSAGFADQSHMTHRFKRLLGITPGEYVRQRKIGRNKIRTGVQLSCIRL